MIKNPFTTPVTLAILRGAIDLEQTEQGTVIPHRLPAWARAQCNDPQLAMAESQPAGVRLVFQTTATTIELEAIPTTRVYAGLPPRPKGIYDLLVDGERVAQATIDAGHVIHIDMAKGTVTTEKGVAGAACFNDLPDRMKNIEIWLPHNETTELVALHSNAPIKSPAPLDTANPDDKNRPVWLHYGSSISQGSNATHPTGTWPAVAALSSGVELINMGFGGGALLDPFVARTIRDTKADMISLKIGINLVNSDVMRLRAFTSAIHGFIDTIRDGHPSTPLLVISPIYCPIHEETPGPGNFDFAALATGTLKFLATGTPAETAGGKLTLQVIRNELAQIVARRSAADTHLHYLDGQELYGSTDHAKMPLPDELHPDAATQQQIGERFAAQVFGKHDMFRGF